MGDKDTGFENIMALPDSWSVVFVLKERLYWSKVECSQIPHSYFQPGEKNEAEVSNV